MNSLSEIPEPLDRARDAMRAAGLDAAVVASPGLVAFLSGHVIPAQLANPSRDGRLEKPTICMLTSEQVVTVGNGPLPAIGSAITYGDGGRGLQDEPVAFDALGSALVELGLSAGAVGIEMSFVPAAALDLLRERGPGLTFSPLDDTFRDAKAVKSDSERAGIEAALGLCDAGQTAVREATAPGLSELELYGAAVTAMNAAAPSQVIALGELQVGRRGELATGVATDARIADGEMVMCDLAPRHPNGWWGDSCSTVVCGTASERNLSDWRLLRDGLEAARELLRPGVTAGEVHAAVTRHVQGMPGHAGHGIGRDHYEEPILIADNPDPLQAGSVIVVEPGIYGDGRGMRIEHAFMVAEDGGVPMSTFELEL